MANWVLVLFSVLWIPTVFGLVRLWALYARTQKYDGEQWLLQLVCWVATLATPVVLYISFASFHFLIGLGALENSALYGTGAALLIAAIVPLINVRFELWMRGRLSNPKPPTNGTV